VATIPASENVFPEVLLEEVAAPAAAATGQVRLYTKSGGTLYSKDDAGAETDYAAGASSAAAHIADTGDAHDASAISIVDAGTYFTGTDVEAALQELGAGGGGGSVATDTIWDAAGDLAVGSGANTAARLAIGSTNGMAVQRVSGAVAWAYPPGYEMDYVEITSAASITATAEASANTVVTASAITFDGSTAVIIEFFSDAGAVQGTASAFLTGYLYDGSSSIGILWQLRTVANTSHVAPIFVRRRITPSAAAHTYSIRATTTSGTSTVNAGAAGTGNHQPAYIRITKV
jgi:hypothetical protein